ncbi:MAG: helix-turn-helix domain-containing protein [Thermoleophilia bacterium]
MATIPRTQMDVAALDAADAACPARRLLGRLAERWTGLVLISLADGRSHRFSDLMRAIGNISQKMLTQTLRSLERDGIVERVVQPTSPPSVEYRLSGLGTELLAPVGALSGWAYANAAAMDAARAAYDATAGATSSG